MCDPLTFRKRLEEEVGNEGNPDGINPKSLSDFVQRYVGSTPAIDFLREGDFATMDELSKHFFGGEHAAKIRELKKRMRLALAFGNPFRTHYAISDYRFFIQKLFVNGPLRQDVKILSFNYDPYFEWRLYRAFLSRWGAATHLIKPPTWMPRAIHSGLDDANDLGWLGEEGFCHLKLHGACVFPTRDHNKPSMLPIQPNVSPHLEAKYLFAFNVFARLTSLCQPPLSNEEPPAILPWEIVHETETKLLTESEFKTAVGSDWQHCSLYPLFRGIWERARREVQSADKISFVGLSFGEYMEPGLRYLFNGKAGDIQMVIANRETPKFKGREEHPNSPSSRVYQMLTERCGLKARVFGSFSEFEATQVEDYRTEEHEPTMTCHEFFKDFIKAEMQS